MNTGVAMLVSTLTVFVRDVGNALTYLMRLLFFMTPVIYPATTLSPTLVSILSWNPFFCLFVCYRAVIAGGMPPGGYMLRATAFAIVLFIVGGRTFLSHERAFALRL
jgi:ABC-type polysaccharide/polyol phosphate export permease